MRPEPIDAAVLAGGLGTRLQGVLVDRPKVLAPVGGRPFLDWLLEWLTREGARRAVLCLGHRADAVRRHLDRKEFPGLEVVLSVEPRPLGTAGAVGFARQWLETDPVVVLNGDTMTAVDLAAFAAEHRQSGAAVSVACVRVPDPGRYGRVEIDGEGRVLSFREKAPAASPGWINGGVYMFGRVMLDRLAVLPSGSLELDVLARMPTGSIHAFRTEGGFLDIGTPQSLAAAGDFASRWLPGLDPL